MIFTPRLARAVATGRKTMTRRPVQGDKPCRYRVGHSYAVQPGRGKAEIARIQVLDVRDELAGDITFHDARREGFRTTDEFKAEWVRVHDKAWMRADERHPVVGADEDVLVMRFDALHTHKPVWVITFCLDRDEPRYLARQLDILHGHGDYTPNRARAIDDLEVIDPDRRRVERARLEGEKQREAFRRDLEAERARRKADRGRAMRKAA